MTGLNTLPSTREQARRALLLLGVPAPARLLAEVHGALFDGDLSVPALAALLREEERTWAAHPAGAGPLVRFCPGLNLDLTAARGFVTLSAWPVADRICTPAATRAAELVATQRVAEFVAAGPGACAAQLLRRLAASVPGGPENLDVTDPAGLIALAGEALADPALVAALEREATARADAAAQADRLPEPHRLFGVPPVPHQRGPA